MNHKSTIPKKNLVRFVIGSLDVGGTEQHLSIILPSLADQEFIPIVICLTHKGKLAAKLEHSEIKVYEPPLFIRRLQKISIMKILLGPLATLSYLVYMYLKVSAKFTCFYLPASYYLGSIAALLTGEKGKTAMFRRSLNTYQKNYPLISKIEPLLHRWQRVIVGNSRAVILELVEREGVPEDKIKLIYNGIDVTKFGDTSERYVFRSQLGLGESEIVLCIVANLIPYKGHMDLLDALAVITTKTNTPWTLLCVGAGLEHRQDLIRKVESIGCNDRVKWLGRRDDIPRILSASDIGLLVSHEEGFSNSILEGMASGLPMIVTDVGGNSEAIEHEKCGLVIRPHDPQGLADAILKLMNDKELAGKYGEAARKRVEQYFSIETCVNNYRQFFKEMTK